MTKIKFFVLTAIAVLGFISCDNDINDKIGSQTDGAGISFTFNRPVSSYTENARQKVAAADGIASDAEWEFGALDVYVSLGDNGPIQKLYLDMDYSEASISDHSTTISMSAEWIDEHHGEDIRFYFVANGSSAVINTASEDDLKNSETVALTKGNNDRYKHLATPLLFSGESDIISIKGGKISKTITLKRRVARFDIVNEFPGRLDIKKIHISNAKDKGYVFGTGTGGNSTAQEVNMEELTIPSGSFDVDDIYESAFYLYPTELDKTLLYIVADIDGTGDMVYKVSSNLAIEANKRYKLVCKIEDKVTFSVVAADWDEGVSVDAPPLTEKGVALGTITISDNAGSNVVDNLITVATNDGGTISIPLNSSHGTYAKISVLSGNVSISAADLRKTNSVNYSQQDYTVNEDYTFDVPVQSGDKNDKSYKIEIKFISNGNPNYFATVYLEHDGKDDDAIETPDPNSVYINILCYHENVGLNIDGIGEVLYFKYGSLIGVRAGSGNNDDFSADDIIYAPVGYNLDSLKTSMSGLTGHDAWEKIPYYTGSATSGSVPANLSTSNVATGVGDPGRFVEGVSENYRTPASTNVSGVLAYNGYTNSDITAWGLCENSDIYGRYMNKGGEKQFYPAVGYRSAWAGMMYNFGNNGCYWSSTVASNGQAYCIYFDQNWTNRSSTRDRQYGLPVRCVRTTQQ